MALAWEDQVLAIMHVESKYQPDKEVEAVEVHKTNETRRDEHDAPHGRRWRTAAETWQERTLTD